jgi:hypothetical protein
MSYYWSDNASHILSLYSAERPELGVPDADIVMAEEKLAVRLPFVLREFCRAYGQRSEFTSVSQTLLRPSEMFWHSNGLVICIENQGVCYWGISRSELWQDNPPVQYIYNEPDSDWLPSHRHLSDFLDYIVYWHVLAGGAPHGGYGRGRRSAPDRAILQSDWQRIELASVPAGIRPEAGFATWPLYVRDGCIVDGFWFPGIAAKTSVMVETVLELLQVELDHIW